MVNPVRATAQKAGMAGGQEPVQYDFFCSDEQLIRCCKDINKNPGVRTRSYLVLLNGICQNLSEPLDLAVARHLRIVKKNIPNDILANTKIQNAISGCYSQLFPLLKDQIVAADAADKTLIESLESVLYSIDRKLLKHTDALLAENVEKTMSLLGTKWALSRFLEGCRVVDDAVEATASEGTTRGLTRRNIYPILSLDGGGIRGIIPAKVLVEFETITGKPISQLFKLIGGTSTGGILALGCTKPDPQHPGQPEYTALDLLHLYRERHGDIFRGNDSYRSDVSDLSVSNVSDLSVKEILHNPKYLTPDLFNEKFGGAAISSALTDVVITANTANAIISKISSVATAGFAGAISFAANALGGNVGYCSHDFVPKKVHYFSREGFKRVSYSLSSLQTEYGRSHRPRASSSSTARISRIYDVSASPVGMDLVAQVTSAAPHYFPYVSYEGETLFDGGVLENNPAIPCFLHALNQGQNIKSLFMVSLGTGCSREEDMSGEVSDIVSRLWFETTQPDNDLNLDDMLPRGGYHRFQHIFDGRVPGLDDNNSGSIAQLEDAGSALVEENSEEIREICKILDPESV